MDRISRHSQGPEEACFGDSRISFMFFVDVVVLLAPSSQELMEALGRFAANCEEAWMRISTSEVQGHCS